MRNLRNDLALSLAILAGGSLLALHPATGSAQNLFPCGGGANEQPVGLDTNGPTPVPLCIEKALAAVRESCLAKKPLFAESSPSTCDGFILINPYVQIVRYPDGDYFGSQAGTYFANHSTTADPAGLVERGPGRWDYCSERVRPEGECAVVVAFLENGEIPKGTPARGRRR